METKLVKGKKAMYIAGRKLLMEFLKNLFISDFGTESRSTLLNFFMTQDRRIRIPHRHMWFFRNNRIRKKVTQIGNNATKWRGNSKGMTELRLLVDN